MKHIFLTSLAAAIFSCTLCLAQNSLIAQMLNTQEAVVQVLAENNNIFKAPQAGAAIDPKTGRIVIARKLVRSSYHRNGAGVLIHPSGMIVTNAHTGHKANTIKVALPTGEVVYAKPIRVVNDMDLLLLKIDISRPLPFVQIADSDQVSLGQEVVTIGNSAVLKNTISGGKIIGIGVSRKLKHSGKHRTDLIQTTVNLYQGDSGGPLFDRDGRLIGLMTADEGATDHSSFAIPSNKIKTYLIEYLESQE